MGTVGIFPNLVTYLQKRFVHLYFWESPTIEIDHLKNFWWA